MTPVDPVDLATSIVQLRQAIVMTRDRTVRSSLRDVEVRLRRSLGPTIPKKKAAAVLGISVTALDRWVDRGVLPVVERPGSLRHEIEARPFLELAQQVHQMRADGFVARTPVAPAVKCLGLRPNPAGKRVLRFDVAALPRPNIPEQELVANFRVTSAEQRVREVAELSQLFAPSGHGSESGR